MYPSAVMTFIKGTQMTSVVEQIGQAFGIMVLGMGLVFIFLSLLIVGVNLVAKWCAKDVEAPAARPANKNTQDNKSPVVEPQVLAAITTAIHQYRTQS